MIAINVFDSTFVGQLCSVALQVPAKLRYAHKRLRWEGVTTFVDGWIYDPVVPDVESTFKVAWLHEARALHPENVAVGRSQGRAEMRPLPHDLGEMVARQAGFGVAAHAAFCRRSHASIPPARFGMAASNPGAAPGIQGVLLASSRMAMPSRTTKSNLP